jgi:beta-lactamase superfamily II metal-dependent hydrolase
MATESAADPAPSRFKVHLLDVGEAKYGDCVLCQFGDTSVLIDGSHPEDHDPHPTLPSIPEQLAELLGTPANQPSRVTLLVVTHAHSDHIGCLPRLVRDNKLHAEWALVADPKLGWGRPINDSVTDAEESATPLALKLMAALREESRADQSEDELRRYLDEIDGLEANYTQMLQTLVDRGTKLFRYGRDDFSDLTDQFDSIGMKVLGPNEAHMLICADYIATRGRDMFVGLSDWLAETDTAEELDLIGIYRQLATGRDSFGRATFDAVDSTGGSAAINNQSIVLTFNFGGHKLLFTGDMQFAKAGVTGLSTEMRALRDVVEGEGPYSFVKIAHHGSFNAFDENVLGEMGDTPIYGISTGVKSTSHPDPDLLRLLDQNRDRLTWVRTDRNGRVTIEFDGTNVNINPQRSQTLNDPTPNTQDQPGPESPATEPGTGLAALRTTTTPVETGKGSGQVISRSIVSSLQDQVEVRIRVPHTHTRISFSLEIEPKDAAPDTAVRAGSDRLPEIQVAGGRALQPLLFVTSRRELELNIGANETAHLLRAMSDQGLNVYDGLPAGMLNSSEAAPLVRQQLQAYPQAEGVVIIGGYDVVPAQRLDVLPADLRAQVSGNSDPDDFLVWSDDIYGDRDGDRLPEVPVSRIPDGNWWPLVYSSIQAGAGGASVDRYGIRNVRRPFADTVFSALPGSGQMLRSQPVKYDQTNPPISLAAQRLYLMLHGDYSDASRFWGEDELGSVEALNVGNIPQQFTGVVFTGCCWGALPVTEPAIMADVTQPPAHRATSSSVAFTFLKAGARAFVGCTGAHYSPLEAPFDYFGSPMHRAFWRFMGEGQAPALALFNAKKEYVAGMPHGQTGVLSRAIEFKILRQYTCLGLGW